MRDRIDKSQLAQKPGDKLPNHAILLACKWYELSETRMLGFVLACTGATVTPFVTWERSVELGPTATGGTHQIDQTFWGHYHADLGKALADYERRIETRQDETVDLKNIEERGREDGKNAAAWLLDGQMATSDPKEYLDWVVKGIDDGDPKILDELPTPRLGGEFADDPTWERIWEEETGRDLQDFPDDGAQDLHDAYHRSFHESVEAEIRRKHAQYSRVLDADRTMGSGR